jgi:hypothetical protein
VQNFLHGVGAETAEACGTRGEQREGYYTGEYD